MPPGAAVFRPLMPDHGVVIASLGWMIAATYWPELVRFATTEQEVGVISGLLIAALLLVSVVALLRTRPRKG